MHIVTLNHYAGSPQHGMEHRPYHLAHAWVRAGHSATVVAGTFSHLRVRNPDVGGNVVEEWIDGVRYLWVRTPRYSGNGGRRVLSMAAYVAQVFRLVPSLARSRPDAVVASSTYPLDIYPARRLARVSGARLVFEVHDLWPLSPMELGGYSPRHPFIAAMQRAEDAAYASADRVVSLLPGTLPHMVSRGMDPAKFAWIPNGLDFDESAAVAPLPDAHRNAAERARRAGRLVVGYAGSHGLSNALDVLLDAAAHLTDVPVTFLLVGDGPEKPALQRRAAELRLSNVEFLPPIARRAVPAFLQAVDVAYLGWNRSPLYRFGIAPNKLLDYMAAARPVLHGVDAYNDPVRDAGCGLSVPPGDPEAVARAVREFVQMPPAMREALGSAGEMYVRANHDYRTLAARFIEVMGGDRGA